MVKAVRRRRPPLNMPQHIIQNNAKRRSSETEAFFLVKSEKWKVESL